MAQWTEHHCVVETTFNNIAPREEFGMKIQPLKGQKRIPNTIAIALAVKFSQGPKLFAIDFTFGTSDHSFRQVHVASCILYPFR